ncbi:hypothetical protein BWQ96_10222 [Gracilariopsis chorda]|uniref:Uncharacterized protein n=1 Tax=Gracilariopsis chorda TaxID=448386 RepID=A0A2V3IDE4_9FLOR|nr:hypothetical protein BWQ96_10222 [Gracilariopsis chorda]|eukprot:PXF40071.1 hypothetical protein BWQ96_10222 [Gracilariopsis chorda]
MTVKNDQDSLLSLSTKGEITAQPHASVLFPDVFGPLSDEDRKIQFNDKKFRKCTKCRAVVRPGQSMRKEGGSVVEEGDGKVHSAGVVVEDLSIAKKRPRSKNEFTKIVQDRGRRITKMKCVFYDEQSTAVNAGNMNYLMEVMTGRDVLYASRYLISPFADCFLDHEGKLNNGAKSEFLKYAVRDNWDIIYPMNGMTWSAVGRGNANTSMESANILDSSIRSYLTVQFHVMNALHYRCNTGDRVTSLRDVITSKMKSVLTHWIIGP